MATSLPDHHSTTEAHGDRGRDLSPFAAAGEPGFDPAEDRVLSVRPAPNRQVRRLPNQHDLVNIDDEELYRRPAADTSPWDE